jgi:hypothetical protein
LNGPIGFDLLGGVFFDIWGRMSDANNGIRCRVGGNGVFSTVTLSYIRGGAETVMHKRVLFTGPL